MKQEIKNFKIELTDGYYVVLDKSWNEQNVCSPFSRLYFVIDSKDAFLTNADSVINLQKDMVYLIPAEYEFSYQCEKLEKIFFHVELLTKEKHDILSEERGIFSLPCNCEKISKLYKSEKYIDILKLKSILYDTIVQFCNTYNLCESAVIHEYSDVVTKVMEYIQYKSQINLTVSEISKKLFISESKIRKSFKDETGTTVGKYIDDLVFDKAKKMLVSSDLSITEISLKLGFCDSFYFSRRFKEKFNKSPSLYRRSLTV